MGVFVDVYECWPDWRHEGQWLWLRCGWLATSQIPSTETQIPNTDTDTDTHSQIPSNCVIVIGRGIREFCGMNIETKSCHRYKYRTRRVCFRVFEVYSRCLRWWNEWMLFPPFCLSTDKVQAKSPAWKWKLYGSGLLGKDLQSRWPHRFPHAKLTSGAPPQQVRGSTKTKRTLAAAN